MQLPLQITARGIELEAPADALIRKYAGKLDRYYNHIMAVRVLIEVPQRRMGEPIAYHVRYDITVPGGEVVVTKHTDPELHTAIQRAFEASKRRLQDYARRQRGDVKGRASTRA
jgi:ribosome-associated translation inhibitor RaiA